MSSGTTTLDNELQILLGALCDGLRQEVRTRQLASLASHEDVSVTYEREAGVVSALAFHLRSVGFLVQVESYIVGGDKKRRPDFRIWLPASGEYLYIELKLVAWGGTGAYQYYYAGARNDMSKLSGDPDLSDKPNGLLIVGFSKAAEPSDNLLGKGCQRLSQKIADKYPSYGKIGLERVNLQGTDPQTSYAMVGLWVRKPDGSTSSPRAE